MGKKKRLFPVGTLRLHCPSKAIATKTYSIYYVCNWNGEKIQRQTGYSCKLSDWDEKKSMVLRSYGQEYSRINNTLMSMKNDYDSKIQKYVQKHQNRLTVQVIRDILDGKEITRKDKGLDFCQFTIDCMKSEYQKNKISWSRTKNGISAMNGFRQFLQRMKKGTYKPDAIYLGEISVQLIDEYISFRRNFKKNADSTINHTLTPIIKACRAAAAMDLMEQKTAYLIGQCRISERESYDDAKEKFDGLFLCREQILALTEYCNEGCCHTYRQREYIEMFLFAFHACGMRVSDIITLRWKNIDFNKKEIRKIQIKTRNRNVIPLTAGAEQILLRWKESHPKSEYVFGFLPDGFDLDNAEDLYRKRNTATALINQSLTAVGHNLKLPFPLTFHRARHSFAMYALNVRQLPMSQVSQLLGHRNTEVTERVYARYLPQTIASNLINMMSDIPIPQTPAN